MLMPGEGQAFGAGFSVPDFQRFVPGGRDDEAGSSDALHDFMKGYNRPYILKTETQTETVSLFSDQGSEVDSVYVGDLEDSREIISRVYSFLRPGAIFGTYTVAEVLPTGFHQTAPAAPGSKP